MSLSKYCQPCQRRITDEGKNFKEEMPRRAVTQVRGIPCCMECSNEIVDAILGQAEAEARA